MVGEESNHSAIGAVVQVTSLINGNLISQIRKIEAASGYASQNSLTAHFGLGNASEIQEVKISWPSGLVELFEIEEINQTHNLIEGTGIMSVTEVEKVGFKIYPNPTPSILNFQADTNGTYNVTILNTAGKQLKSHLFEQKLAINVSEFPTGIYFYQIQENNRIINSGKFVKN